MNQTFSILCRGFCLLLLGAATVVAADGWHAGPLFDEFELTRDVGHRTEALGPFFYEQESDSNHVWAVPPFFSRARDPVADFEERDYLYPAVTYDRFGTESRWQFGQLISFSSGAQQNGTNNVRSTLFPFYFQQRSADPDQNYTAVVPFYGHFRNRFLRDRVSFVMLPLYCQSQKRDIVTDNYFYPFFHLRHGNALRGWQAWPFVGHERKEITTKTNGFNEIETIPGPDKFFILWPFYFDNATGIGSENPERQNALLPAYFLLRSPNRDSTSVLWPFFSWVEDREKKYREWDCPFPFVGFARGEGKTMNRVLPFFSRARSKSLESDSYLWPLVKYNRLHSGALDRERTRILFILFSSVTEKNTQTGDARTRTDFWPLFTHHRDFGGNTRLQILAPIEPVYPNHKSIGRNWSPLWSLWRSENNPKLGKSGQSFLWNFFRRETAPGSRKGSLLFGLIQYHSDAESKQLRLLFIPVMNQHRIPPVKPEN